MCVCVYVFVVMNAILQFKLELFVFRKDIFVPFFGLCHSTFSFSLDVFERKKWHQHQLSSVLPRASFLLALDVVVVSVFVVCYRRRRAETTTITRTTTTTTKAS